jgi:hypothetical protein
MLRVARERSRIMSDDKNNVGKADRDRVAANQPYEVDLLVQKFGLPKAVVEKAIQQFGPMRKDIERHLSGLKSAKGQHASK